MQEAPGAIPEPENKILVKGNPETPSLLHPLDNPASLVKDPKMVGVGRGMTVIPVDFSQGRFLVISWALKPEN